MSRLITSEQRLKKAEKLIQKAYDEPAPEDMGWASFTYIAQIKDILRQAFDMVKFIPKMPSASDEQKAAAEAIFARITQAEAEILHPGNESPEA